MSIEHLLHETITAHLPPLKHTPSGWAKTNCPVCVRRGHGTDRRERFGVLFQNGGIGINCFNCGFGARWEPGHEINEDMRFFMGAIGIPDTDIEALKFQAYLEKHNITANGAPILRGSVQTRWKESNLPPDTHSILWWLEEGCDDPHFLQVAEYAIQRKVPDLTRVAWSPTKEHMIRRRLLVPFYHRRKVVGYTGRMTGTGVDKKNRYYDQRPESYVFNLDNQRDYNRKYTIVCEGVFDALVTDGIAVLHNKINDDQAQLINNLHTTPVLCPDRNSSGDPLVEIAARRRWHVSFPKWPAHIEDAAQAAQELGVIYTVRSILNNITNDPDKIRVWRRLDQEKYVN